MQRFGRLVLAVAATACGSSGGSGGSGGPRVVDGVELMDGFDPGTAPAAGTGFQVVMPIVKNIEPDGNYEYCTWTNIITTKDLWLKSSHGVQTKTGHHTIIYYTTDMKPAGTSEICKDSDTAGFRFGIGAGGEGVSETNALPGDLAVHIPAGAQIVVNHHYLNTSTQMVPEAQSAVNVWYADPTSKIVQSSSIAFLDTAMVVPVGASSVDFTCTFKQDLSIWMMVPHMHAWGTHITVDHTSGANTDRLFDLQWDPSYTFHPPITTESLSTPYMLKTGDTIHLHCEYDNTTNAPLSFGQEMCVSYMQSIDPTQVGNVQCDQGQWGSF